VWYAFAPDYLLYLSFAFAGAFYLLIREPATRPAAVVGSSGRDG